MANLDGKIQDLSETMKQFLANAEGATNRLVEDVIGHWQGVSAEFRDNMEGANESLRQMRVIPEITESRFAGTLAAIQKQSQQILNETWQKFVSQLQGRLWSSLRLLARERVTSGRSWGQLLQHGRDPRETQ